MLNAQIAVVVRQLPTAPPYLANQPSPCCPNLPYEAVRKRWTLDSVRTLMNRTLPIPSLLPNLVLLLERYQARDRWGTWRSWLGPGRSRPSHSSPPDEDETIRQVVLVDGRRRRYRSQTN